MANGLNGLAALSGIDLKHIIFGVLVLVGVGLVLGLLRLVGSGLHLWRNSLPALFFHRLKRDLDSGELAQRLQEPKSLPGMERIYGPQISADFPELNLAELQQRAEQLARDTLAAKDTGDPAGLSDAGDLYRAQFKQDLAALQRLGQADHFSAVTIHRCVLSDYMKSAGTCRIGFQLAIGAEYRKTAADGQIVAGGPGITQFRLFIEALYVQDRDRLDAQELEALAVNCPNCGAPVPALGARTCQFCNSAIEPVNNKVWTFSRFALIF
jgi:hypothetical protein